MSSVNKDRIQRLAKIYGPWLRFYPEGNEGADDALDKTKKAGEKAEVKEKEEYTKQQQLLDQERATARRANEAARTAQSNLDEARAANETLKKQLEEAEAKAAAVGITDVDLKEEDYDGTDLSLVKAIKAINVKLAAKEKEINGLKKKAVAFEEQVLREKAAQATNSIYEELLSDLDGEYGEENRNEAVKKFNELAAEGKVPKGNPAKATRIMENCYKEAKVAKSDKSKSKLPLDSGSGGGESPNLSGVPLKEGSLDEVVSQYSAASKKK